MTVSTDANLYYGIQLGAADEVTFPWQEEDLYWEEYYAMQMGLPPIELPYNDETKEIYSQYWDKRNKLVDKSECSIGIHCSHDYPMYYVYISKSATRASRGYPEVIESLNDQDGWDEAIEKFCKLMGLEYEQPQWWLSSMWG